MEGWIEGALVDFEDTFRNLLNALGDGPAVHSAEAERAENKEVQGALEEVESRGIGERHDVERLQQ